jgi:hypothetical protein
MSLFASAVLFAVWQLQTVRSKEKQPWWIYSKFRAVSHSCAKPKLSWVILFIKKIFPIVHKRPTFGRTFGSDEDKNAAGKF